MEEKLKAEDELAEIDRGILELMELLDGIETSSMGVEITSDGSLQTVAPFIKMVCCVDVTKDNVGINNEKVFEVLKDHYSNPKTTFDSISADMNRVEQILNEITSLKEDKQAAEMTHQQVVEELGALNSKGNRNEENKTQIEALHEQIDATEEAIDQIDNSINGQESSLQIAVSSVRASKDYILQIVTGILPKIDKALSAIDKILLETEVAAPMIKEYEEVLASEKEYIDADVYSSLEESLAEIKKYVSANEKGYDFEGMKSILTKDRTVLITTQNYLAQAEEDFTAEHYQQANEAFEAAGTALSEYQIGGLTLDYSSLVLDKSGQNTPIEELCNLFTQGLTDLVMDESSISDSELTTDYALPSEIADYGEENGDWLGELSLFLENSITGQGKTGMDELFETFSAETEMSGNLADGMNEVTEQLLYQEYLKDHFGKYQAEYIGTQEFSDRTDKPSTLEYEQEYLLAGKSSDQNNISSVVTRIILLRTVADFTSILGNKSVQAEAKLVAASLVGFTGMPMLISLTQVLILLMWAFAEALLDTCALMIGKEVPILKKSITLQFPDLFLINRKYLQQKALQVPDSKELSISYQDYLRVFLFMSDRNELTYRSMDLMQENIRLRYQQEEFQIINCLYGFETEADYIIGSKFTAFSYVQKYIDHDTGSFRFTAKIANSY
jgi:hypothetical protein